MSQHPGSTEASAPSHPGGRSGVGADFVHQETAHNGHVPEAVLHLKSAIQSGTPWQQALLEAIGLWTLPDEVYQGRTYHYMIQGEAFDWLMLAERLCAELDGFIPAEEKERLLFQGKMPEPVEPEAFRDLLGRYGPCPMRCTRAVPTIT